MIQKAALRHFVKCLDGQRVPLNSNQRAEIPGEYPYWGANGVVDTIGDFLFDEELVLLGEDGAPFDDPLRDVAFRVMEPIWVNNHIHVLRPQVGTDTRFLTYALNSVDWMPLVSGSTRYKLTQDDMMRARIPFVPLNAQRAIADFLDTETERIDTLISKKRRLAELLEERRRTLITQAVTGQHPDLKSGATWPSVRLEAVAPRVSRVIDPSSLGDNWVEHFSIPSIEETGFPEYVRASEIGSSKQLLIGGEVMVSRLNPRKARVVPVPVVPDIALASGEFVILAPKGINSRFLTYLLLNERLRQYVDSRVNSVTRSHQRIRPEVLLKMRIPFPSPWEQRAIADFLDTETERIDQLVEKINRTIELLQERRRSLITAAVTGELRLGPT